MIVALTLLEKKCVALFLPFFTLENRVFCIGPLQRLFQIFRLKSTSSKPNYTTTERKCFKLKIRLL